MESSTTQREELLQRLHPYGQEHLLTFWDELDAESRGRLANQIQRVDFALIKSLIEGGEEATDWEALAASATGPRAIRKDEASSVSPDDALERGREALRSGQVGMILVAGGQGTRLGFDRPKGMFQIGPISQRTLFQILIDRLRAVMRRYSTAIPLFVMTSPATHLETVAYFEQQDWLGLTREGVHIFCQGVMPAVDPDSGKLLLEDRDTLLLSPDGHGGMLAALKESGCMRLAAEQGIELFFYGQIDNPLLQVCDPYFLGGHLLQESEMTTQVVRKRAAEERVGNVVEIEGRTCIIEYSDLPDEAAQRRDTDGELELWAGNLAVHAFDLAFLQRVSESNDALPFHFARKKANCLELSGVRTSADEPNAMKFERFIFDLLPVARRTLVVEVDPAEAFAPVKNADGAATDTPTHSRRAMIQYDQTILRSAGVEVAEETSVEIHPLWAMDSDEVASRIDAGTTIRQPTYFAP